MVSEIFTFGDQLFGLCPVFFNSEPENSAPRNPSSSLSSGFLDFSSFFKDPPSLGEVGDFKFVSDLDL